MTLDDLAALSWTCGRLLDALQALPLAELSRSERERAFGLILTLGEIPRDLSAWLCGDLSSHTELKLLSALALAPEAARPPMEALCTRWATLVRAEKAREPTIEALAALAALRVEDRLPLERDLGEMPRETLDALTAHLFASEHTRRDLRALALDAWLKAGLAEQRPSWWRAAYAAAQVSREARALLLSSDEPLQEAMAIDWLERLSPSDLTEIERLSPSRHREASERLLLPLGALAARDDLLEIGQRIRAAFERETAAKASHAAWFRRFEGQPGQTARGLVKARVRGGFLALIPVEKDGEIGAVRAFLPGSEAGKLDLVGERVDVVILRRIGATPGENLVVGHPVSAERGDERDKMLDALEASDTDAYTSWSAPFSRHRALQLVAYSDALAPLRDELMRRSDIRRELWVLWADRCAHDAVVWASSGPASPALGPALDVPFAHSAVRWFDTRPARVVDAPGPARESSAAWLRALVQSAADAELRASAMLRLHTWFSPSDAELMSIFRASPPEALASELLAALSHTGSPEIDGAIEARWARLGPGQKARISVAALQRRPELLTRLISEWTIEQRGIRTLRHADLVAELAYDLARTGDRAAISAMLSIALRFGYAALGSAWAELCSFRE